LTIHLASPLEMLTCGDEVEHVEIIYWFLELPGPFS